MAKIDAFGGDANAFLSAGKLSSPGPWNEATGNTPGVSANNWHFGGSQQAPQNYSNIHFSGSSSPMYATDIRDYGYWDPESGGPDPYNRFSSDGFFGPYDLIVPWGFTAPLSKVAKAIPLIGAGIGMVSDWWRGDVSPTLRK